MQEHEVHKKGVIKVPIEIVFDCLIDIELLKNQISWTLAGEKFQFHYDKKQPFGVGKRLIVTTDKPFLTLTEFKTPYCLSMKIEYDSE